MHGVGAGVDGLGDALDVAALAGRIPTLVHEHERNAFLVHLELELEEALLLLLEQVLVLLFGFDHRLGLCMVDLRITRHDDVVGPARCLALLKCGLGLGCLADRFRVVDLRPFGPAFGYSGRGARGIGRRLGLGGLGCGIGTARKRMLDGVDQGLRDLQVGSALVLAVDQDPRRKCEVCVLEQAVVEVICLVVVLDCLELLVAHAPRGIGVAAQPFQALPLSFLAHVHEQLDDDVAVVDEHLLETMGDALVARYDVAVVLAARLGRPIPEQLALLGLLRKHLDIFAPVLAVDDLEHGAVDCRGVPSAVVKRNRAALAERSPELLHGRLEIIHAHGTTRELLGRFDVEVLGHVHARRTGIELVHQIRDAAALASAAPTFQKHDKAHAGNTCFLLQHDELADEFLVLGFVFFLR